MTVRIAIEIDPACCVGSSICATIAPRVFEVDHGLAAVRDPGGAPLEDVLEAAEGCPTMAITVRDAATGEIIFPNQA